MRIYILLLLLIATFKVVQAKPLEFELSSDDDAMELALDSLRQSEGSPTRFKMYKLISPASPLVIGSLALYASSAERLDMSWSDRISSGHGKLHFDDYLQYSPAVLMLGLDALGYHEPYHKFKQQTTVLAMSAVTSLLLVQGTKRYVARRRPDTHAPNSFPSGHTATAFMCAEMLHKEFGHHSPWISITGYTLASVTGFMRVYNERHYFGDVLAGAGIGMLSARLAYWLAPGVNRFLWGSETGHEDRSLTASLTPCVVGQGVGVNLSLSF